MTMFSLAKAVGDILAPEFVVISVFPAGQAPHELTLSLELEDEISVTARIGCDANNNPAALQWLQRKYAREVASIAYLESAVPSVPVPYVIQIDQNTANPVQGPYVMVEDPLGEQLQNAVADLDMSQKEFMVTSIAEALAGIYRHMFSSPASASLKFGAITGTGPAGAPLIGPISRSWLHSSSASRPEGPFSDIKQFLSNELTQCARVAQDDEAIASSPQASEAIRSLLRRLNELLPAITPLNDPAMIRPALSYSDLRDQSLFILEDGALGGMAGLEATVLPACLAAAWPTFLRRDGIHSKNYRNPKEPWRPTLPDNEVAHLREVFIRAAAKVEPSYPVALQKGERLRQMLEFMNASNWEGLRRWESDVRRELSGGRP
ncbi:Phosphotransferase enzyme [Tulasnella sp. 424]|nr:Phosphotransferase enzyme [Tulasnella sp. 424]KAG8975221.1 Phosphotransferase enzyme [Tulasnella sp. 425]